MTGQQWGRAIRLRLTAALASELVTIVSIAMLCSRVVESDTTPARYQLTCDWPWLSPYLHGGLLASFHPTSTSTFLAYHLSSSTHQPAH